MTYDPGTDTVTTEENLTPEEQESLKVGEEIESQQDQLLAGKYTNAEELEKAYIELQGKLGSQEAEAESTTETEDNSQPVVDEAIGDVEKPYNEDGSINTESVNEVYGEPGDRVEETTRETTRHRSEPHSRPSQIDFNRWASER